MRQFLTNILLRWAIKKITTTERDVEVDKDYMDRWHVIPRNPLFNVYLHHFIGSDAPIPHNHPWWSFGWILAGSYKEHVMGEGCRLLGKGSLSIRGPNFFHWIEIDKPVITLFITGPRLWSKWGFMCESGFIEHEEYIRRRGSERLASGCGEA